MTRLTTPITLCLLALSTVPALAQDAEAEDRRRAVEMLHRGECLSALALGDDGPAVISLGSRAYLGVELTPLTPELRRHFGVRDDAGVLIGRVDDDSPAAAAGLRVGDILTRFDGQDVASAGRLRRLVHERAEDDAVILEYWRDGRAATATVTLGERPRCGFDVGSMIDMENFPHLDLDMLPRVFELGELPDFEGLHAFEIDGEEMRRAAERMRDAFESRDWERQLERLEEIDLSGIERRLQEAMDRLRELENEIRDTRDRIDAEDE